MTTPDPKVRQFMEGLGAERTSMDEWRISFPFKSVEYPHAPERPYVFFSEQQATYLYQLVTQAAKEAEAQASLAALERLQAIGPTTTIYDGEYARQENARWRRIISREIVKLKAVLTAHPHEAAGEAEEPEQPPNYKFADPEIVKIIDEHLDELF